MAETLSWGGLASSMGDRKVELCLHSGNPTLHDFHSEFHTSAAGFVNPLPALTSGPALRDPALHKQTSRKYNFSVPSAPTPKQPMLSAWLQGPGSLCFLGQTSHRSPKEPVLPSSLRPSAPSLLDPRPLLSALGPLLPSPSHWLLFQLDELCLSCSSVTAVGLGLQAHRRAQTCTCNTNPTCAHLRPSHTTAARILGAQTGPQQHHLVTGPGWIAAPPQPPPPPQGPFPCDCWVTGPVPHSGVSGVVLIALHCPENSDAPQASSCSSSLWPISRCPSCQHENTYLSSPP